MNDRPSVLVVEDNPTEQKLVKLLLDRYGFNCVVASSGMQSLELAEHGNRVDLILMDWQMEDMNGLECTRRMREVQQRTGLFIPIVAVTARAMLGDKQKCLSAGMDDYLSKPYTPSQFEETVNRWARQTAMRTG